MILKTHGIALPPVPSPTLPSWDPLESSMLLSVFAKYLPQPPATKPFFCMYLLGTCTMLGMGYASMNRQTPALSLDVTVNEFGREESKVDFIPKLIII